MWCQLESASADPTRVSGEEIAPLDAKGWASVLPFQSLAKVGPRGEGAAWPPWQLPFNLAQVSIDRGSWEILEASTLPAGFPSGSDSKKKSACNAGTQEIPGLGRCPGEGNGNPLQYSCLENLMDRGAVGLQSRGSQGRTQLSD